MAPKPPAVLNMVFENEFSLFYPLIQFMDILPHSKAWVPGLFRQRPHLVEIGIVERPQAGVPVWWAAFLQEE